MQKTPWSDAIKTTGDDKSVEAIKTTTKTTTGDDKEVQGNMAESDAFVLVLDTDASGNLRSRKVTKLEARKLKESKDNVVIDADVKEMAACEAENVLDTAKFHVSNLTAEAVRKIKLAEIVIDVNLLLEEKPFQAFEECLLLHWKGHLFTITHSPTIVAPLRKRDKVPQNARKFILDSEGQHVGIRTKFFSQPKHKVLLPVEGRNKDDVYYKRVKERTYRGRRIECERCKVTRGGSAGLEQCRTIIKALDLARRSVSIFETGCKFRNHFTVSVDDGACASVYEYMSYKNRVITGRQKVTWFVAMADLHHSLFALERVSNILEHFLKSGMGFDYEVYSVQQLLGQLLKRNMEQAMMATLDLFPKGDPFRHPKSGTPRALRVKMEGLD